MAGLQQIFDSCRALYKKAYANVKAMAEDVAAVLKEQGKKFDPRITTGKFDVILQYSLLQVAVSDNDLDRNELIFIRDLTDQGDFVNYINSLAKTSITWEKLYNSNISDVQKVLNSVEPVMVELSKEFVVVFTLCDLSTEHDFLDDFKKAITALILGLSVMDGDPNSEDLNESILIVGVLNAIQEIKNS